VTPHQLVASVSIAFGLPAPGELGDGYCGWCSSTKISNIRGGSKTIWLW
jgi:hypothetical protein